MPRALSVFCLLMLICFSLIISRSPLPVVQADATNDERPTSTESVDPETAVDVPNPSEFTTIPAAPHTPTATFVRGGALEKGVSSVFHEGEIASFLGYDWVKVYDPPSQPVQNAKVLLRIDMDAYDYYSSSSFRYAVRRIVRGYGEHIDAYEIGNEPNLWDEWGYFPNAYQYARTLCVAYDVIRTYDSSATVVSAGLAPVGRIDGIWDGHYGHNGYEQDEREYIQEFIMAGGHNCADAIGYHPMGFSADFDVPPDVNGGIPTADCTNGFCFRGIEKFWQTLETRGITHLPLWATEVGWITEPPADCLTHPSWAGREWQIVTPQKQAENINGAITYAEENYPWLENIFVFNLNFDEAHYYDPCEQMRYYAYNGRVPSDRVYTFMPLVGH